MPAGTKTPILSLRSLRISRATAALLGVRYNTALSIPCLAAATAGNSQFARCAEKTMAGFPSSRSLS